MRNHATLRDAILYFAEFENCCQFMIQLRWPDGVVKVSNVRFIFSATIDEQAFLFNNRDMTDIERFVHGMTQIVAVALPTAVDRERRTGRPWLKGEKREGRGKHTDRP
jgi:hypothetical protein